jgi:hypothetical protein
LTVDLSISVNLFRSILTDSYTLKRGMGHRANNLIEQFWVTQAVSQRFRPRTGSAPPRKEERVNTSPPSPRFPDLGRGSDAGLHQPGERDATYPAGVT